MPDADSNRAEIPSASYGDMDPLARLQMLEMSIRNLGVSPADVVIGLAILQLSGREFVNAAIYGDERLLLRKRISYLAGAGYSSTEIQAQTGLTMPAVRKLAAEILPEERRSLRALERLLRNPASGPDTPSRKDDDDDETAQMKF